ncbi:transposase [Streptomyces sp. NPDC046182]|uniref:transposase n=1 Tax=unclassified Streptomyces TaxID=2593676 RepID=UPI0033FA3265
MPCVLGASTACAIASPLSAGTSLLGVDGFALRKRDSYATILVDLDARRPLDVLPGRDAAPLAAWLRGDLKTAPAAVGSADSASADHAPASTPTESGSSLLMVRFEGRRSLRDGRNGDGQAERRAVPALAQPFRPRLASIHGARQWPR